MSAAVGESAWLAAMIRFEVALARAEARAGLLSTE
jgi:adenylosuccinate lyase